MTTKQMIMASIDVEVVKETILKILSAAKDNEISLSIWELKYLTVLIFNNPQLTRFTKNSNIQKWKEVNKCQIQDLYIVYKTINQHIQLALLDLINSETISLNEFLVEPGRLVRKSYNDNNVNQAVKMLSLNREYVRSEVNEIA